MKKRLVLAMLVTVVLLLLIAPAANAVWVGGIDPWSAYPGQTVDCAVTGTFTLGGDDPYFELRQGVTTIVGTTSSLWDSVNAGVTFTIPATAPPGAYTLYTRQVVFGVTQEDSWSGAFTVIDTVPVMNGITPDRFVFGSPPAAFVISGSNFIAASGGNPGAMVIWHEHLVTPTSVTWSEIVVSPPSEVINAHLGIAEVTVRNPNGSDPNGPYSVSWPVTSVLPPPHITDPWIQPASLPAGSPTTVLDVWGDTFYPAGVVAYSTVVWDDGDLPTTYVSGTHLQATVSADKLTTPGTHAIKVINSHSPLFGSQSISVAFDVTTPVPGTPVITGVSPSSIAAGSPTQPITVNGTGFTADAVVYWNSTALTTTSVTPGIQLSASVPASLLATAGSFSITVHNGTGLGAPVSAPWAFSVTSVAPGTPSIVSLSPTSATAAGAAFPLIVNGSGFIASSVVVWTSGGASTDLATTFTSATQLTAQVPASLIAAAGTASVTVRNGGAGSPVSAAASFTIASGGGGGGTFALSSLEPTQVYVGYVGPGILLTVNGSGFLSGAHIWLGTQEKTNTTFVSATKLTTTLLPADLASIGTIQVSVKNPPAVASPSTLPLAVSNETTDPTVTIQGADSGWHNRPVTLTFAGSDPQSGVQKVQYRCPPAVGAWTTGTTYTVPASTQGEITVSAQVFDWCDRVGSASAVVKIDITRPIPDALNAVSVKRGKIARLRFRVSEPAGLSPTATVLLQVKKGRKVVMSKTLSGVPMNATEQYSFRAAMTKGSYAWYVSARDEAGNVQAKADKASFRVN